MLQLLSTNSPEVTRWGNKWFSHDVNSQARGKALEPELSSCVAWRQYPDVPAMALAVNKAGHSFP